MSTTATVQDRPVAPKANTLELVQQSWIYRFLLFPIGQMLIFIAGATILLTVIAYAIAIAFPAPNPNIDLVTQINRQLPGMIISGVSIGFVYSMIALGYTLVYGVLQFINFAHSELFMVGSATGFVVMKALEDNGVLKEWNPILMILFMLVCAMTISGILAMLMERIAYRPLRGAPRLVPLITAIGISFFLIDFVRAGFAITRNEFNLTYPVRSLEMFATPVRVAIGETTVNVRTTSIMIIISAVIMLVILNYIVNGTKLGRGIRAVAQDQTMSGLLGVNVNLMISLTFLIGGAFGGAAGMLFGMNVGTITPYVGFLPGLKAFTAAVLGGIGNITGALLGGLTIGIVEAFLNGVLVYYPALGQRYTDILTFSVLILILIFRPTGILGKRVDEKV